MGGGTGDAVGRHGPVLQRIPDARKGIGRCPRCGKPAQRVRLEGLFRPSYHGWDYQVTVLGTECPHVIHIFQDRKTREFGFGYRTRGPFTVVRADRF